MNDVQQPGKNHPEGTRQPRGETPPASTENHDFVLSSRLALRLPVLGSWWSLLIPLISIVVTFVLTTPVILIARVSPLAAYYAFLIAPFTSRTTAIEVLVKTTPLLLTGTAVAFAFAAGYYNIGAEGQLYAGALLTAWIGPTMAGWPTPLAIVAMVLGGFAAGMAWAWLPAFLRTHLQVDEVVTTLLLNSVMLFVVSGLLNGPWRNPVTQFPQSPNIAAAAEFPMLLTRSRLHLGFLVALLALVALGVVLGRTALGLRMRAVGRSRASAQFVGVNVPHTTMIAALVSGGIAGLAGVGEVAGLHHHLIDALSPGYGYSGIIIATLGGAGAWGVGLAALFLATIQTGAQEVSRTLGVPIYLADIVQATLLLVSLVVLYLSIRRRRAIVG
jgi:general nucleoside transport system permease protein